MSCVYRRRHAACHRRPPHYGYSVVSICVWDNALHLATDFVRVFVDFIGFWDPVGVHLGIIFEKKCDFFQNVFRASKKHRPPANNSHIFEVFLYKIVIESCVFLSVFSQWLFTVLMELLCPSSEKMEPKGGQEGHLKPRKTWESDLRFRHILPWFCLILEAPEGSGGTLFPIVFPNSAGSMLPMLLFEIL